MPYLLDTDTCVDVIRGREPVRSRVREESPDDLFVSAMTVAELQFGALNSSSPGHALAAVEAFLSTPILVEPFGEDAAVDHADIRLALKRAPIGERDLVIAATARAAGHTLVTRNRKHFERVPGLRLEDWSVPAG